MAAIPGFGHYTTTEPYRIEKHTCTCCAVSNTAIVEFEKPKPLTFREKKRQTMEYFKSFNKKGR